MGLVAAAWATVALAAVSGVASNVRANRAKTPKSSQLLKAPEASFDKKDEDEIDLGSDRARTRNKRASGRRQLMSPQQSTSPSTGLQI